MAEKGLTGKPERELADALPFGVSAMEYWTDAWQRSVLFLDVMRQRGDQYREHAARATPHVWKYEADFVCDGRQLQRPVNYLLVRIRPTEDVRIDPRKRPFVIVDPRAGHGPGIGGFKADSEIGVALKAGHPCYFFGFLPEPMPGQTIGDIARAEAVFLETVIARHPEAEGKPCVIGNCQAGWAVMLARGRPGDRPWPRHRRPSRQRRLDARCSTGAASTAPWASPRSTGCPWERGPANSTRASCSTFSRRGA